MVPDWEKTCFGPIKIYFLCNWSNWENFLEKIGENKNDCLVVWCHEQDKKRRLGSNKNHDKKMWLRDKKKYVTVQCLLKDLLNCKERLCNFHSTKVKKFKNTILFWLFVNIPKICSIEKNG